MFLSDREIRELIINKELISDYIDLSKQLQPNGFDLTVDTISAFRFNGVIDFSNIKRKIAPVSNMSIMKTDYGYAWDLDKGVYRIKFNETVKLPENLFALTVQRSSLMRCGCDMQVGLWDAGYNGKGESILKVHNEFGLVLYRNARVCQILFLRIRDAEKLYDGIYQKENI